MPTAKELGLTTKKPTSAADLGLEISPEIQGQSPLQSVGPREQQLAEQDERTRQRQKEQANLYNTISETVGGNFSQKPLDDFGLVYDMKRSDDFSEKRAKFKDKYPGGKLIPIKSKDGSVTIVGQRDENEPFKTIENVPAEVAQALTSGQSLGAIGGAVAGGMVAPAGVAGAGIAAGGTFLGSLAGQQAESAIERYRGYEHDSFTGALSEDIGGAAFDSAIDLVTMGAGKLIGAGKSIKPSQINLQGEIRETAEATYRQDLEPLVKGQATESPLVRGIFFQAAGTSGRPRAALTQQKSSLKKRLDELSESDFESFSDENLGYVLEQQTRQLDSLVRNPNKASDEAMEELQQGIDKYKQSSKEAVDRLYDQAKNVGSDVSFDISSAQKIANEVKQGVLAQKKPKTETVESPIVSGQGKPFTSEKTTKGTLRATRPLRGELKTIVDDIQELTPTITTFSKGGKEQPAFDQIKDLRTRLFDLKNNENAPGSVRSAAKRLYGSLSESMYNPVGGDDVARQAFMKANKANAVREANLEKQQIKRLIRSEDPAMLANQFISPNRVESIATIKELAGDEYFKGIQDYFKSTILSKKPAQAEKMFKQYQDSPRAMDILMPNKNERKLLQKRIEAEKKLENSPIKRHYQKMETSAERAIKVAESGTARDMKELLESSGGGIEGPMAKDMRAGIYAKIRNDATTTTETGQEIVNPDIVRNRVEDLKNNEAFKVLFNTKEHRQRLDDFRRAAAAMGGEIDVGGSMQAGEARGGLTSGTARMFSALRTIGSNELFGYYLSRPADYRKLPTGQRLSIDALRATSQSMNQIYQRFRGDKVDPEYIKNPQEKAEAAE